MQLTILLNKDSYTKQTAEDWEAQVFILNFKTFNYAMGNDYHTDLTGPVAGMKYNQNLIDRIKAI